MIDLPFPLEGRTLVVGPSNAGKTRLTARALAAWIDRHGANGVVVLDFGPEIEREGRLLGGRLDRFVAVPDTAWHGAIDAHGPRAEGEDEAAAVALAADNARRAADLIAAAPAGPRAVFVNDATIAFQHPVGDLDDLFGLAAPAACVVLNAFESDELGTDDAVSRAERRALERLRDWVDRTVELDTGKADPG